MLLRSCCTFWSAPWTCASHPVSPLATGFTQSTVHDDSDVAAGSAAGAVVAVVAVGAGAAADAEAAADGPAQLPSASVMTRSNWALTASPSAVPYFLTRAVLTCAADMPGPDAGSTDTTAIAFPNDMSRSKYPMTHESWLPLPPPPAAAVNWLVSALVHWPGGPPWARAAPPPPAHAVTVNAAAAAASGPASRSCFCVLMNAMDSPLIRFVLALIARPGLLRSHVGSAPLAEPVAGDNAGAARGAEIRGPVGRRHRRRGLPSRNEVLVLEREQQHGGDQAGQGQPAGRRVQEALAYYARARIEHRDGVTAWRKAGG